MTRPQRVKKSAHHEESNRSFIDFFFSEKDVKYTHELIPSVAVRIIQSEVPGYVSRKKRGSGKHFRISKLHKHLTDPARTACKGVLSWALAMHSLGKSLNGKFCYNDMRVTSRGFVKCSACKMKYLKKAYKFRILADLDAVKKIIMEIAGARKTSDLPTDLQQLLRVLSQYKEGDEVLIKKHPALKKDSKKLDQFGKMFGHLELLKKTELTKYQRIIGQLPYGKGVWKRRIKASKYLLKIFGYGKRMNSYADSPEGLIRLYRNSTQHLGEHAFKAVSKKLKRKKARRVVVLFRRHQINHMLCTTLPKIIGKLTEVLHAEDELMNALS
jgi:hypothetical protein